MKHPASADAIESAISRVLHSVEQGFTLAPTFLLHLDLPSAQTIFYLVRSAIIIENDHTAWERWTQGDLELNAALDCILENTLQKFLMQLKSSSLSSKSAHQTEWHWIQQQFISFTKSNNIDKRHFKSIIQILCKLDFPWDHDTFEYIKNWLNINTLHTEPLCLFENELINNERDCYLSNLMFSDNLLCTTELETIDLILHFCYENVSYIPYIIEVLLLHPRQFIRQQCLLILEQHFPQTIPNVRNRLVQIRNWLPELERESLDNFIYYHSLQPANLKSNYSGSSYVMKHCLTLTTDFNNQGYQAIISLVKIENNYVIFNALLSHDLGWSEVWRGHFMTLSQAYEVINQFCQDHDTYEVEEAYMHEMIPVGIGWMQSKGNIPSHILSLWCDALGISNKHPQFHQEIIWLEKVVSLNSTIHSLQNKWINQIQKPSTHFARYLLNLNIKKNKNTKEIIVKNHISITHKICLNGRWIQYQKNKKSISWQEHAALADLFLNCIEKTRLDFLHQWMESLLEK
ncbi:MAG: hypothetical protein V4629_02785 [Pseudomonadota bacterium]